MNKKPYFFIGILFMVFHHGVILSQITKDTTALAAVTIVASPTAATLQNTAASIMVINRKELDKSDGTILTSVLNKVPGLYMQQGALNTVKISIRGIGSRSQYGTQKIKAYFEGIPLTTAEGESTIEDIDLENIGSIEIIKGPNSSSFGSGLGGVIHLFAREIPVEELQGKSSTTYGSFGLLKQSFSVNYGKSSTMGSVNYSHLESDGFRQNSSYDRKSLTLQAKQKINTKGELSFIGMYTQLKAYIPSSINEDDFNNNPEKAASNWAQSQGYESYNKWIMGVGYRQQLSSKWTLKTSVFSNIKKAYEPRPFNILDDESNSIGFRSSLNYKNTIGSVPFETSLGTEMAFDDYSFSLFENLYASQPNQGSIAGAKFSKKQQKSSYQNYFLQMDFSLSPKLHLETGLAFNTTRYSLRDLFAEAVPIPDLAYTFGKIWSPRAGLSYSFTKTKTIYASISKGFSTPSVAETLTPEGQINTNLKPEIGWNYELGLKAHGLNNKLYTELTFFSTQTTNLLVARRTAEDQYIGINAGASSHTGVEFLLDYQILQTSQYQLSTYFTAAVNHFTFKDFVDGVNDYSGNQLTAVPDAQWNVGVDLSTTNGFKLHTAFSKVGAMPLNDLNSKYTQAYSLLDLKTSYTFTLLKSLKTELSTGINNALNAHYAASILPNAVGFGQAKPRYYYPGNPRNYYGGISLSYLFK
ncbi:TonB-dependent receptor [Flavobacterium sp. Arc3]|uniref:TonB-dependent receptor family protein n=1 Tax=Flavobacterium sp. Arc3 TaxID=3046686 RepID=UPI00352C9A48